ncbi:MAG: hypothetical protein K6G90_14765 [Clostridia bacterium]|nr:hypothetical protein [Clostridia bacterium]
MDTFIEFVVEFVFEAVCRLFFLLIKFLFTALMDFLENFNFKADVHDRIKEHIRKKEDAHSRDKRKRRTDVYNSVLSDLDPVALSASMFEEDMDSFRKKKKRQKPDILTRK